ncbi:hypothetical protein HPB48_015221 [Haemaphysalis longicornis]|uniref:DNA topoisomerase (ATP-hydrolyzing) n=1 Tax=Haemaphysalis longicornis TaxID=44386 RepID=A0A9J6FK44_HAELO|nr:hypothetical protein HPB48_015221 [Haemaphysalis longicornis]
MIMTDEDQEWFYIKSLLITFISHNLPLLLKLPFLEELFMSKPKVTKSKTQTFDSLPDVDERKHDTYDFQRIKDKYYKRLGTSTVAMEAKYYFQVTRRHRVKFNYQEGEDHSPS